MLTDGWLVEPGLTRIARFCRVQGPRQDDD